MLRCIAARVFVRRVGGRSTCAAGCWGGWEEEDVEVWWWGSLVLL